MSKILYASSYRHKFSTSVENKLAKICDSLVPDNVKRSPKHKICVKGQSAYAVTMANNALHESDMSVLLGFLFEEQDFKWDIPKNRYPDGNYSLFRNSTHFIEVVSDFAGTRTIWYYHDDELFVASTSQRALIMFLGSFEFDKDVISWILSTGSLGPELSWDKRLKRLQPDSSLLLDKKTWKLTLTQNPVVFSETKRLKKEHKNQLIEKIGQTIGHLRAIDFKSNILPLSGGYDSRAILCFIKEQMGIPKHLTTLTWGLEGSVNEEGNDAEVAIKLARKMGVKHEYHFTDSSSEPISIILNRFILASEGRIDHISAYMDGMEIWRQLHDRKIAAVIRGDEGFGWKESSSDLDVKMHVGCALCSDFDNLKSFIEDFDLSPQQLPTEMEKKPRETLPEWRDRLYHSYRMPTILAALSDAKLSYIELANPLLSKNILSYVRSLPDDLRTEKNLFKEVVVTIGPNIPFAGVNATAHSKDILKEKEFLKMIEQELQSNLAVQLFGKNFIQYISEAINAKEVKSNRKQELKIIIGRILPRFIKHSLRKNIIRPTLDSYILGLRVFIILRMNTILNADAAKLKCPETETGDLFSGN